MAWESSERCESAESKPNTYSGLLLSVKVPLVSTALLDLHPDCRDQKVNVLGIPGFPEGFAKSKDRLAAVGDVPGGAGGADPIVWNAPQQQGILGLKKKLRGQIRKDDGRRVTSQK